jgi:hypothetical protein
VGFPREKKIVALATIAASTNAKNACHSSMASGSYQLAARMERYRIDPLEIAVVIRGVL